YCITSRINTPSLSMRHKECDVGEVFLPPPVCGCECVLTDKVCQETLGPHWIADTEACECVCNRTAATCPAGETLNVESCGCDCPNITTAYCQSLNPLFGLAPDPAPCGCTCG